MTSKQEITQILQRWSAGEEEAVDRLLPMLYAELKHIAHGRLLRERVDHTLNTTALVHEAYIKLVDIDRITWQDRSHFLAMASRTMRRVLVDYALKRNAEKRGGGAPKVELDEDRLLTDEQVETVLDLHEALEKLAEDHPRASKAVELKYFGEMTLEESGEVLGVSPATVMRDLRFAEAWLGREWSGGRE